MTAAVVQDVSGIVAEGEVQVVRLQTVDDGSDKVKVEASFTGCAAVCD